VSRTISILIEESLRQGKIVAEQSNKAVNYNMLKHEVDTSRQLYELLLQRVKEAAVASAIQASNIIVVDPARRPLRPYKPNMVMNAAIGLLSGLFLSLGTVFVMELSDRRLLNPGDAQVHLNLPELGLIPQANIRYPRRAVRGTGKDGTLAIDGAGETLESQTGECLELVTWNRKPSPIAESFRAVLPSILLGGHSGQRPRIIVMTSPSPGEGKTTVASNLAISIAEITHSTLIIDGDMRRPRLHDVFGVRRDPGLGDLLSATTPLDWRTVNSSIRPTMVAGLSVLPCGTAAETLSNLFYSRRLPELLMVLRQNFDTVIIDAPPILNIPDARLLGRLADGVIMVVRAGQTQRQSALVANQQLGDDGTLVLGTIFNSWDPKSATAYTYGYTRTE
jgi:succinoglycan biosynthesis transport protein ExoP